MGVIIILNGIIHSHHLENCLEFSLTLFFSTFSEIETRHIKSRTTLASNSHKAVLLVSLFRLMALILHCCS